MIKPFQCLKNIIIFEITIMEKQSFEEDLIKYTPILSALLVFIGIVKMNSDYVAFYIKMLLYC